MYLKHKYKLGLYYPLKKQTKNQDSGRSGKMLMKKKFMILPPQSEKWIDASDYNYKNNAMLCWVR